MFSVFRSPKERFMDAMNSNVIFYIYFEGLFPCFSFNFWKVLAWLASIIKHKTELTEANKRLEVWCNTNKKKVSWWKMNKIYPDTHGNLCKQDSLLSCFAESHVLMAQGNLIMTRYLPWLTSGLANLGKSTRLIIISLLNTHL